MSEKSVMESISLTVINPSKTNPRKNFDKQQVELIQSVKTRGVLQPILLRPDTDNGRYEIMAGERRFRAAKEAGLKTIPAIIREMDDQTALELQVIENLQRADLHPLEEAEGYELLMKKYEYVGVDEIAAKVGKSRAYVYGRMKLCDLVPANRKFFHEGKFTPSTALLVARVPKEIQKEAGKAIAEPSHEDEPLSYRKAQEFLQENFMLRLKDAPFNPKDEKLCPKAGICTTCPKRTGNQQELFSDIKSADVCTDIKCFGDKKAAHVKNVLIKAKEAKQTILSKEEQRKVFPHSKSSHMEYSSPYVDLQETCYEVEGNKSYKKLFKSFEDLPQHTCLAVDPTGTLRELILKKDLPKLLTTVGVETRGPSNSEKKNREEARQKEKEWKEIVRVLTDQCLSKVFEDAEQSFWRPMAETILYRSNFDTQRRFVQRRNPEIKGAAVYEEAEKILKNLPEEQLPAFCRALIILNGTMYAESYGDPIERLIKHCKIDEKVTIKNIRKEMVLEARTKKK